MYHANVLNATPDSELVKSYPKKDVFNCSKLIVGQRLLPGRLTRAVDANQVDLQQEVKMNGAFRIHVFAGDYETSKPALKALDEFISSPESFVNVHRPAAGVASSIVNAYSGIASRHIEADTRDPKLNPFFVSFFRST